MQEGEHRARQEGARRPGGQRPRGLRDDRGAGQGRARSVSSRLITSRNNETLKLVRKLASRSWRDKLGLFVAEGEDLVEAARTARIEPVELLVSGETVEPRLIAEVSQLPHPPRVIGVFRRADLPGDPVSDTGLALWRVGDPGNVGTLMRSADAFGAFLALSEGCADLVGPKALRASAGAAFRVATCPFEEAPGRRIALAARSGRPLAEVELDGPVTFVLGAERAGLPGPVVAGCDEVASIPTAESAESLNVAAAGAIALYERARRIAARPLEAGRPSASSS